MELEEVRTFRLKMKAMRPMFRDILASATAAAQAMDRANGQSWEQRLFVLVDEDPEKIRDFVAKFLEKLADNAQPQQEAQRDSAEDEAERYCAA